jgi:hypothetical protein
VRELAARGIGQCWQEPHQLIIHSTPTSHTVPGQLPASNSMARYQGLTILIALWAIIVWDFLRDTAEASAGPSSSFCLELSGLHGGQRLLLPILSPSCLYSLSVFPPVISYFNSVLTSASHEMNWYKVPQSLFLNFTI